MNGLWVFIVKAATGGAMFRALHATFLHEPPGLLQDERLTPIAAVHDDLTAAWVALPATAAEGDHAAGLVHVDAIATARGVRRGRDARLAHRLNP